MTQTITSAYMQRKKFRVPKEEHTRYYGVTICPHDYSEEIPETEDEY